MKISKIRNIIRIAALCALFITGGEVQAQGVRVHCKEDTAKVSSLLKATSEKGGSIGQRCVTAARELEGTPWAPPADNDSLGTIMINLHGFDRLGFVNIVLAAAEASMNTLPRVEEFEKSLESFSRRKGIDTGFASQLIYGSDWVVDNVYRGKLKEMTEYLTGGGVKTKTLDYISRHKDEYPALKNPEVLDKVKMMEMGYRSHRIPHLKKQSIGNKTVTELMNAGDIVILLSNELDFDIYDIGIVDMENGEPHLIHISRESGKVVRDPYPLSRLFKLENQHFYGYRWLRPVE